MRNDNITMLQNTLDIFTQGYYIKSGKRINLKLLPEQMREIAVYLPKDIQAIRDNEAFSMKNSGSQIQIDCLNMDSYSVARRRAKDRTLSLDPEKKQQVLVLNLANPVHPGGGVRLGARAQEEVCAGRVHCSLLWKQRRRQNITITTKHCILTWGLMH